jgi:hypothetical protein
MCQYVAGFFKAILLVIASALRSFPPRRGHTTHALRTGSGPVMAFHKPAWYGLASHLFGISRPRAPGT